VLVVSLATCPSIAWGQEHPVADAKGFQTNRDYFSQVPFEHIDTATGALILTFTDLVLPGHMGRDLKFQRTYNSKDDQWTFGLAGYILYIYEPGFPPVGADPEGFSPTLYSADGGQHRTVSTQPVDMEDEASIKQTYNRVSTDRFWRYERRDAYLDLYLPDGTHCEFEEDGPNLRRLSVCWSSFGIKELSIDWETSTVTQHIVDQERSVVLDLVGAGHRRLPTSMTFMGKSWTYEWGNPTRAFPPIGPKWEITKSAADYPHTLVVKTPQGGQIGYEIENKPFPGLDTPEAWDVHSVVVAKRWTQDRGTTDRHEWLYTYQTGYADTTVLSPLGSRTVYRHEGGTTLVSDREVWPQGGASPLEVETRDYTLVPVVVHHFANGNPMPPVLSTKELASRTITRHGRTYTTTYEYQNLLTTFGDYHHPWRVAEEGDGGARRVTVREYDYSDYGWQLNVGHLEKESVNVGNQVFEKEWDISAHSGQLNSKTIHGVGTEYSVWSFGRPHHEYDANGYTTQRWYDWGVVSRLRSPETVDLVREVRPDGTIASETENEGSEHARTTHYQYDDAFRLIEVRPAQATGGRNSTKIEYDNVGGAWTRTTKGTAVVTVTVDGFGRPILTTSSDGTSIATRYDAEGRTIHQGRPVPVGTPSVGVDIEYDALGRLTKRTHPDGTYVSFTYGPGTVTVRDEKGRNTIQHVSAFGDPDETRLVGLTDANNQHWAYEYNTLGNLTRVIAPDGKQRTWTYLPEKGWLDTETHPESGTTTYSYAGDAVGNVKVKTLANGQTVAFSYDKDNRIKTITTPSEVTTITYESGSRDRSRVVSGPLDVTYHYDDAGRPSLTQTTMGGRVFDTRYEYDPNDNLREIVYPSLRRVRFDVDGESRMQAVRDVLAGTTYASGFTYHASGAVAGYTAGNGIGFSFGYHPQRQWPTEIQAGPLSLSYGDYDAVGNVGTIGDGRGGGWTQTFTYDALDRLTQSSGAYGNIAYTYDAHGNMQTMGTDVLTYDATTLRLAARNGQAVGYDLSGNIIGGLQGAFAYNAHNQMSSATVGGQTTSYAYDPEQWRVLKTSGSTTTYYLRDPAGQLLTEVGVSGSSTTFRDYIYAGSRLLAVVER
jgi:YD repeat-containing protein